ncbi:unnamed protein product [Microthlaspi erraticum]|uniref:Uncharacterized protein n=1 Tax=Microthlaspi erraticum TaxID=1685480 RepID=A0A6D2JLX1_9BRAS|nr:unnamed protein product [Microthlaspi erraticum]
MRTRSSSSTKDLVELDNNIGRKQRKKSQRQQAETEVFVTDTSIIQRVMESLLLMGRVELGRLDQLDLEMPQSHQQRQGIVPPPVRTTTLRSSWE